MLKSFYGAYSSGYCPGFSPDSLFLVIYTNHQNHSAHEIIYINVLVCQNYNIVINMLLTILVITVRDNCIGDDFFFEKGDCLFLVLVM